MTSDSRTDITAAPRWTNSPFPWFALQVRTRHEQGIASRLRTMGYEEFLPIYQCRKSWSDRTKVVAEPLFPSYLFCRFDPQNRLPILQIPGVIQVIGCNKRPIPVDESEIRAVQALVASRFGVQPWPFLEVGTRVVIESGALRGLVGILVGLKGHQRLVLSVTLLQRSVSVEIDAALVKAEDTSATPALQGACAQVMVPVGTV
jgi:transcription antitermination factor NusG